MQHGHRHEDLVAALDAANAPGTDLSHYARGTLPYVHPDGTVRVTGENVPVTWMSQDPGVVNAVTTGPPDWKPIRASASNVIAVYRFRGGPGRERDAAEAWAFEITYYFLRGVGEQPVVEYANGIYTASGMMTTTHPGDHAVTDFGPSEPPGLDGIADPLRRTMLREIYPGRKHWRFDGRDSGGE